MRLWRLESGITRLEQLFNHVSLYVNWWDCLRALTYLVYEGRRTGTFNCDALKNPVSVQNWVHLRDAYMQFTYEIRTAQDSYKATKRYNHDDIMIMLDQSVASPLQTEGKVGLDFHNEREMSHITANTGRVEEIVDVRSSNIKFRDKHLPGSEADSMPVPEPTAIDQRDDLIEPYLVASCEPEEYGYTAVVPDIWVTSESSEASVDEVSILCAFTEPGGSSTQGSQEDLLGEEVETCSESSDIVVACREEDFRNTTLAELIEPVTIQEIVTTPECYTTLEQSSSHNANDFRLGDCSESDEEDLPDLTDVPAKIYQNEDLDIETSTERQGYVSTYEGEEITKNVDELHLTPVDGRVTNSDSCINLVIYPGPTPFEPENTDSPHTTDAPHHINRTEPQEDVPPYEGEAITKHVTELPPIPGISCVTESESCSNVVISADPILFEPEIIDSPHTTDEHHNVVCKDPIPTEKTVIRKQSGKDIVVRRTTTALILKQIQINPPRNTIDLDALADSTELAFRLLVPWCQENYKVPALILIAQQAVRYIQAIDFSIVASQQGFNIAEEALSFSETLAQKKITRRGKNVEAERQVYLRGMVDLAVKGHKTAEEAMEQFRDVRGTLLTLIDKARIGHSARRDDKSLKLLSKLESSISVLERFADHISLYVGWWNKMEMLQNAQESRTKGLLIDYNSLHDRAVIRKWEELKQKYVQYTNKVRALQDRYPTFFIESRTKTPSSKQVTPAIGHSKSLSVGTRKWRLPSFS
ncbi:hypothetical protein B0H34DRAFT_719035 [Crassisporium funariophilum]|nr:hypothetical protein B0H34DRAFT_719035 [Crassisporium funariophilum]